jgi:hypothetical protein
LCKREREREREGGREGGREREREREGERETMSTLTKVGKDGGADRQVSEAGIWVQETVPR